MALFQFWFTCLISIVRWCSVVAFSVLNVSFSHWLLSIQLLCWVKLFDWVAYVLAIEVTVWRAGMICGVVCGIARCLLWSVHTHTHAHAHAHTHTQPFNGLWSGTTWDLFVCLFCCRYFPLELFPKPWLREFCHDISIVKAWYQLSSR